jgi:hypothetical protein
VGVIASRASLVLEPSSSFVVMLKKRPHKTSPDEGSHPQFCAIAFSIRSLSPYPIWAWTWLALCSTSSLAAPSPVVGLSPCGVEESSRHRLSPSSPSIPTQPSSSEVDKSSEEWKSSDDVDYHQLLKDYREVQVVLSSTRLNTEMIRSEQDAMRDTLQVSKNEVS